MFAPAIQQVFAILDLHHLTVYDVVRQAIHHGSHNLERMKHHRASIVGHLQEILEDLSAFSNTSANETTLDYMTEICKTWVRIGLRVGFGMRSLWCSVLGAGWSSKGATETATEDGNDPVVAGIERCDP
ncbi:MAG: hypothetical protein NXY57DRAFT_970584 [Lentinula lateritia]|nr:MAG: hypothetical protein NXY57DRAFT_970584 [Lentinula lateritia]